FIYGGNGSGKTTFMHSFLGLLRPNEGTITFNGRTLADENYGEYKRLFSVVFNDFYLFDQFYGNEGFDVERARNYLSRFDMEGRVEITEHGFSTTELSTGQRKRLALISAILEDKPILVLDEWAADQDPYFRRKFYEEILPELKAEGRTVLAITHDDAYYRTADKVYRMEYGKLIDDTAVLVQDQPEETLT
ncbi:MAG TPA: hypothetical protein DCR93_32380, partial [Cytophagales bacterium]|nr:hypothetical protein [Cytophagales bacterium]